MRLCLVLLVMTAPKFLRIEKFRVYQCDVLVMILLPFNFMAHVLIFPDTSLDRRHVAKRKFFIVTYLALSFSLQGPPITIVILPVTAQPIKYKVYPNNDALSLTYNTLAIINKTDLPHHSKYTQTKFFINRCICELWRT